MGGRLNYKMGIIKKNKRIIITGLIIFFAMFIIGTIMFLTTKYQHDNFCNAFGYEESIGWCYAKIWCFNQTNYVDCCDELNCERIYFISTKP